MDKEWSVDMQQILDEVKKTYNKPITFEIAKVVYTMWDNIVKKKFAKKVGISYERLKSFHDYINSQNDINMTDDKIKEIAREF